MTSCNCDELARHLAWLERGPFFDDLPQHAKTCAAVNVAPREGCDHLWRGDMGDITAPAGYVKCAHCSGVIPEDSERQVG